MSGGGGKIERRGTAASGSPEVVRGEAGVGGPWQGGAARVFVRLQGGLELCIEVEEPFEVAGQRRQGPFGAHFLGRAG